MVTHKIFPPQNFFAFKSKPPKCTVFGQKWGWSQDAPREGPICARPPGTPFLGFCWLERTFTLGGCLRKQGSPACVTHVIYAAVAISGDNSPSRQCTEMTSYVWVRQVHTCGVPNMVMDRQIENERNSHHWHFLGHRLSIWGALAHKKGFFCISEDELLYEGKDWCTWEKRSFKVCANRSIHALRTFQHPVHALSLDGLGSVDCHARPCRPWAERLNEDACSIAGSLWTVQSVSCCCLIVAWGPVTKSSLDPVAGLGKLGNMSAWFLKVMLGEKGGHGGSRCRWNEKHLMILVWSQKH